jgi:hypothetical protein
MPSGCLIIWFHETRQELPHVIMQLRTLRKDTLWHQGSKSEFWDQQRRPLLGNGPVKDTWQLITAATEATQRIWELWEEVFSVWSAWTVTSHYITATARIGVFCAVRARLYNEGLLRLLSSPPHGLLPWPGGRACASSMWRHTKGSPR